MKWGIVGLVILGLVAATCAALLVGAMRSDSSATAGESSSPGIEVAMARASLPAMTVITVEHFVKGKISQQELPPGEQLVSPAGIVGRVLAVPVVEGQVLTQSCFVRQGTGSLLAAALPHGMRAVSVSLSGKTIPDAALLYPGCVVDVLVSFKLPGSSRGTALSTTMLRGVQVLAVAGYTVVSNPESEAARGGRGRSASRSATVTLLVNPKQAEALQLAAENGSVSLTIRNPLDMELVHIEGTVLSQGKLANLGSVLTVFPDSKRKPVTEGQQDQPGQAEETEDANSPFVPGTNILKETKSPVAPGTNTLIDKPASLEEYRVRQIPRWGVTVIRGTNTKLEELVISKGEVTDANEVDKENNR
jgi:pilus assembly protein CpaB